MIAFGVTDKSSLGAAAKSLYMRWAVYGLLMGLLPFFPTDNAAHVGGLVSGFVAAWLIRTPNVRTAWKEPLLGGLAGVCIALTLLSFVRMYLSVTAR